MDWSQLKAPRQLKLYGLAVLVQLFGFVLAYTQYHPNPNGYYPEPSWPAFLHGTHALPVFWCTPVALIIVYITVRQTLIEMSEAQRRKEK